MANENAYITVFSNGQEVLDGLEKKQIPDFIFLDINMPIMDGWEFLDIYDKNAPKACVYMLTSSTNATDMSRSKQYKCIAGYLSKPISKDIVANILKV